MKLLDLQAQYAAYQQEIDEAIRQVFSSGQFIGGPAIRGLEEALSEYCESPHVIACASGTDALLLPLMAWEVGPGDEVITTPYSFIATGEVIALLRARTVFVDVDPDTFNIDALKIEEKITDKTKAIVPVSLFGEVADMATIGRIGEKHGIPVLEDAAQSFGAIYGDASYMASSLTGKSGNLSEVAATSFFPAKPLGCYGDGGAVFCRDGKFAGKVRQLMNHGQSSQYYHDDIGINGRLDAIQAAILSVKLKYLDQELESRNRIADYYRKHIESKFFIPQKVNFQGRSVYAQYCLVVNAPVEGEAISRLRQRVRDELTTKGVPTGVYYPVPIHLQKPFQELGYRRGDFPVSERLSESMFALPIHPFLSEGDMERVVDAVNETGRSVLG